MGLKKIIITVIHNFASQLKATLVTKIITTTREGKGLLYGHSEPFMMSIYLWPCRSSVYDRLGHCTMFASHKQRDRYLSLYKRALYTHKSCFQKNLYFSCYSKASQVP